MSIETLWFVLAGVLLASEMLTGTFYLLMLGAGALAGALCSRLGAPLSLQIVIASLIGLSACFAVWQMRGRRQAHASQDNSNPLGQLDVGETVTVTHWNVDGVCEVKHRGAMWAAVPSHGDAPRVTGLHRIVAVDGVRLVIESVQKV